MTADRYFADRHDLWKPGAGLVRQDIPKQIRNFVRTFVRASEDHINELWWSATIRLDLEPTNYHGNATYMGSTQKELNTQSMMEYLRTCGYGEFLNLCECICEFFEARDYESSEYFFSELNDRFIRYYSAYRMGKGGRIGDPGSQASEQAIEQARALLRSPDFEGPDRQFQSALLDFHSASMPNYEGAIADALNAVEGVARIVLGDASIKLGSAAATIRDEKGLHSRLANSIQSLHDYASDEGGRHGLVGDPKVDRPIAEFCLHQAAASIVFIARLYGHEVVEGN